MNPREMDKLVEHCNKYFQQSNCLVFHPEQMKNPHIDFLKYPPNDHLPYWKLVTMGASDIKMPHLDNSLGDRNEYVIFVDPSIDLDDHETFAWFGNKLLTIALYPKFEKVHITYGHSVEWGDEEDSDMAGAYLEMPMAMGDPGCMRCKLSLFKQIILLQPVMLTRKEIAHLLAIGPEQFSYHLYPRDKGLDDSHFICERFRSKKF